MTDAEFMAEWASSRKGSLHIPREVLEALEALAKIECECCGTVFRCTSNHCIKRREALRKFRAEMEGK